MQARHLRRNLRECRVTPRKCSQKKERRAREGAKPLWAAVDKGGWPWYPTPNFNEARAERARMHKFYTNQRPWRLVKYAPLPQRRARGARK